jgi:hypothetical protein
MRKLTLRTMVWSTEAVVAGAERIDDFSDNHR